MSDHDAPSPCCQQCGKPVALARTGRPRVYCSNKCRQKRRRCQIILLSVLTEVELVRLGITPIDWSDELHRVT